MLRLVQQDAWDETALGGLMFNRRTALAAMFLAVPLVFTAYSQSVPSPESSSPQHPKSGTRAASKDLVLRLDVRRVPVDVVVTDKNGNPVRGLKKEDFTVKEDKKTQRILTFNYYDGSKPAFVPTKLPPLPANTFVNIPKAPERGPLYVLYYDMVNTTPGDQMAFHKQVLEFVDNAEPGTRIALFVNSSGLHLIQGFTSDHALLRNAILSPGPGPRVPKVFIFGNVYGYEDSGAALSNLKFIAEYLGGIPGRKNLIWLSSEFPIPVGPRLIGPQFLDLSELQSGVIKSTYSAMMRSRVALYPVDLRGIVGGGDSIVDHQYADDIAAATGGRAFYSDNKVNALIDKAIAHGENYYSLSYSPSNTKYDGSDRHIDVTLARKGDYTVSFRTLYYALPDDAPTPVRNSQILQARFVAAKSADTLYANIEHGAPMLHDLLFSSHLAAEGSPVMATADQMAQLEDSPAFFRTRSRNRP
jgi:VWFA-related protein